MKKKENPIKTTKDILNDHYEVVDIITEEIDLNSVSSIITYGETGTFARHFDNEMTEIGEYFSLSELMDYLIQEGIPFNYEPHLDNDNKIEAGEYTIILNHIEE